MSGSPSNEGMGSVAESGPGKNGVVGAVIEGDDDLATSDLDVAADVQEVAKESLGLGAAIGP